MNRKEFLRTGFCSTALASAALARAGEAQVAASAPSTDAAGTDRPNVIVVFTDDQGYGDIGCFGAIGFETPHLDKMAKDGLRLTNFYAAHANCTPSRASLLTGAYAHRVGLPQVLFPSAEIGLNRKETTVADMLKDIGYKTAVFGKWHLGDREGFLPLQHGFDHFLGIPYSNDMWPVHYDHTRNIPQELRRRRTYPELPLIRDNEKVGELRTIEDQNELTTLLTEAAVEFIDENRDGPFFIYMPHPQPHVPLAVSDKFKGKSEQGLYGDVMMELDWSMGEIINALDRHKLSDNTLILFTSDNGPWLNYGDHAGSAGGLREGKGTMYEGGQRVPAIVKWPRVISPGRVSGRITATLDLLPTIAEITGSPMPENKIDGVSLLPILKGEPGANPRRELLYYMNNRLGAVRKDEWKLILPHRHRSFEGVLPGSGGFPGDTVTRLVREPELYDLRRDPGERYNVYEQNPEVVNELMRIVERARNDLGDDLVEQMGENLREPGRL